MIRWLLFLVLSGPSVVLADWISVPAPYHRARLSHLQIDDTGRWILSAADDGDVRLWMVKTRQTVWRSRYGHYQIEAVALARGGRRAAIGLKNGTIVVVSLPDGLESYRSRHKGDSLTRLRFSKTGRRLAAVYKSGRAVVVDLKTRKAQLLPEKVNDLDFSSDGRWLASGPRRESGVTRATIWDSRNFKVVKRLSESHQPAEAGFVRFSPDQKYLVSSSGTTVWLWSLRHASLKPVSLDVSPRPINIDALDFPKQLRFSADGNVLQLTAFGRLFRYRVPSPKAAYSIGLNRIRFTAATPSNRLVVGERGDGVIYLLKLPRHGTPLVLNSAAHIKPGKAACQSIVGNLRRLITGNPLLRRQLFIVERQLKLLQTNCGNRSALASQLRCMKKATTLREFKSCTDRKFPGKLLARLGGPRSIVTSLEFQPSSPLLATNGQDGSIALWDRRTGVLKRRLFAHLMAVRRVTFSRDGKLMASGGSLGEILIWNTATYKLLRVIAAHQKAVTALRFSHSGRWLVSGSADRHIHVWNVANGKRVRSLLGHTRQVVDLAIAPGDKLIASTSEDATTRVWSLTNGKQLQQLKPPLRKLALRTVAFSPDGKRLLSATAFGFAPYYATIWDPLRGRVLQNLTLPADLFSAVWSDSGLYLGFSDGRLEVRSTSNLKKVMLTLHNGRGGYRLSLALSPDGRYLASGSGGNQC